jgi:UDP:flavonoid glycosyltransferase YjiC (YdhE family)
MRIMISSRRGAGHFGPLVPFAKAFLRDNDEVIVVAPQSARPMVAAAGLDHLPYPDPPEEERSAIFAEARQLDFYEANRRVLSEIFVRIDTTHAYPHLLAAMRRRRPDAVVYDVSEFAAPLAAEALGIPAVCVGITASSMMGVFGPVMARELDKLRAVLGLRPDPELEMLNGAPYFTLTPAELESPGDPSPVQAMRFREDAEPPRPLPDWWDGGDLPLVYLTFGSVAPTMGFFPGLYRNALDALALLPVRVLVTVGRDRDPREIGPVGPNVHVARWVPQTDVMPHTAAMICHGGSGTVRAGLAAGVPMAVVPLFADQHYNADRVAELGAGIALDDTNGLADAVRSLLVDPSYREAAERIAEATRQLPSVDLATSIVRALARRDEELAA